MCRALNHCRKFSMVGSQMKYPGYVCIGCLCTTLMSPFCLPILRLIPQKWNIFPLSTYSVCSWHIVKVVAAAYWALQICVTFEKGCCNCNISWNVDMKAELTLPLIFRPVMLKRKFWVNMFFMFFYAAKSKIMMFKLRYRLMLNKHHLPPWFFTWVEAQQTENLHRSGSDGYH